MWRRSWALVPALLGALLLGAAPAGAEDGPSGWLELDAGPAGEVHRLTPGGSVDWAVDVRVPGDPATSLVVTLGPDPQFEGAPAGAQVPSGSAGLADFLSVGVKVCGQPWVGSTCPSGARDVLPATELTRAKDLTIDLMEPGSSWSAGTFVLLTATLDAEVPAEVQGSRSHLVVGVQGSGDDVGGGGSGTGGAPATPAAPGPAGLADTGFRLGGAAVLGMLAVGAGFWLARLRGSQA